MKNRLLCAGLIALWSASSAVAAVDGNARALSLSQAEELLRANAPALRLARYSREASSADVVTAGEAPNPQLSFNSTAINYQNSGSGPPWDKQADTTLRVDQLIERGGKRELRQRAARAGERAAFSDYSDALRTNRLSLAQAYFELKYAQEAERISATLVDLQTQSLQAVRLRLKNGDVANVDVARLEIEVARATAELSAARTAKRDAQLALAELIGLTTESEQLEASDEWPAQVNEHSADSYENRPDVHAAEARRDQAAANVELARAQRTRDVTVGLQFEHYPQPFQYPNSVGFGFSVPLFLRHRYEGELQRASADRRIADETLRSLQIAAAFDQQRAAADIAGARERLRNYQESIIEKAKSTAESAEYAYSRGALDLTDLLDARRAMQAVTLDALAAQASYAKAHAAWRAATDSTAWSETP